MQAFFALPHKPVLPNKTVVLLCITLVVAGIVSFGFTNTTNGFRPDGFRSQRALLINSDSIESVEAYMDVYKVLMSPRCMNCHPAGDVPLQGDDSHIHTMGPKRGEDGKGIYAMKCSNCHQNENLAGLHMPPGNPKWGLPPAAMRMVFQGKSPYELAVQMLDPEQNGHKNKEQLIEHMTHDPLVLTGWHPADGLAMPPLSQEEFSKRVITWLEKGAYVPAR